MKPLDSYSDPESWLADLQTQLTTLQEQGQQANDALRQAHGTGTAANGDVTVVVGQNGQVQSLRLNDNALRLGPTKLSQAILAALRTAQNNAVDAARDAVAGLIGAEKAHEFLDRYRLPDDEEEPEPHGGRLAAEDDLEDRPSASWVRKDDGHKRW